MHAFFRDVTNLARFLRERFGVLFQSLWGHVFVAMTSLKEMLFGLGSLDFRERYER